jgi:protein TonB
MFSYLGRVAIAGLLTVSIFLFMRYLINPQNPPELKETEQVDIRITREKREESTQRKDRKMPEEPMKTPPPPPPAQAEEQVNLEDGGGGGGYEFAFGELKTMDAATMPMSTDRRAIPIVRIPPRYPETALRRGIEGWVLLEFTITELGSVEDIKVVDADPPNVFERESIRALKNWKYQPKVVNGKPVPQPGMQDIIVFEIKN